MALDVFAMVQQLTAECALCHRKAMDLCICPCRQVFYCDVQCQQDDWHRHRTDCTKARRGRLPQSFCSYCGVASVSLKSCLCEAALYCSFDCQRKHHGVHGRTCSAAVPRFRRRRKKETVDVNDSMANSTSEPTAAELMGSAAVLPNGKDLSGRKQNHHNHPEGEELIQFSTAEIGIQTDESCEALLASVKRFTSRGSPSGSSKTLGSPTLGMSDAGIPPASTEDINPLIGPPRR